MDIQDEPDFLYPFRTVLTVNKLSQQTTKILSILSILSIHVNSRALVGQGCGYS